MPGVYKRPSDRARGSAGKWTIWYQGADGKKVSRAGFTDKGESLRLARSLEAEAQLEREGVIDSAGKGRRDAARRPIAEHVEDYRLALIARGGGAKHAANTASALRGIFAGARIASIADIAPDRLQTALGDLRACRSDRTCNAALTAVKAFTRWLVGIGRIDAAPRGLALVRPYNLRLNPTVRRRAASREEIARLFAATEKGPTIEVARGTRGLPHVPVHMTGPERALLYRLALGTGFRANELRQLTPECFHLDGREPWIDLHPAAEKNRKGAAQPITVALARAIKPRLKRCEPGKPVIVVPAKTAKMLKRDLAAAGIPIETTDGTLDFHALRASYITHLVLDGVNPAIVQKLARHSSIVLTMALYAKVTPKDVRQALDRLAS